MPPLVNHHYEQLCQEYVKAPNDLRRAATRAGYKDGPYLLRTIARIFSNPLVAARISELRREQANEGSGSPRPFEALD